MNDFSNNNNNSTYFNNTPQAAPRFGVGVRRVNEEQNFNMSFEGPKIETRLNLNGNTKFWSSPYSSNGNEYSTITDDIYVKLKQERDLIICVMRRRADQQGFGMSLSTGYKAKNLDEKLMFPRVKTIEPNSASDIADLKVDDLILEINGISTHKYTNEAIVNIIRNSGDEIQLLVAREKVTLQQPTEPDEKIIELNARTALAAAVMGVIRNQNEERRQSHSQAQPSAQTAQVTQASTSLQSSDDKNLKLNIKPVELEVDIRSSTDSPSLINERERKKSILDRIKATRTCHLIKRNDFRGFGFGLQENSVGPHQIINIIPNSPAQLSGLQNDDYLLKINDEYVVGESYGRVIERLQNEKDKSVVKLEVIEPEKCPIEIKKIRVNNNIDDIYQASLTSIDQVTPINTPNIKIKDKNSISSNINTNEPSNGYTSDTSIILKRPSTTSITGRVETSAPGTPLSRPSTSNLKLTAHYDTRSFAESTRTYDNSSMYSGLAGFNANENIRASSRSTPNLQISSTPRFKRCTIHASSVYKGFGFTLNAKLKPKHIIYDVEKNSPADLANVKRNDILIEVNSKNIRRSSFEKIKSLIGQALLNGRVELLVISYQGYQWYKQRQKRFSQKLTTEYNVDLYSNLHSILQEQRPDNINEIASTSTLTLPFSVTNENEDTNEAYLKLKKDRDLVVCVLRRRENFIGFGMSIATDAKNEDGQYLHVPVVTAIETNSPSDEGGLHIGDFILEINDKSTFMMPTEGIANIMRNAFKEAKIVVSREKKQNIIENRGDGDNDDSLKLARNALAAAVIGVIKNQNNNEPTKPDAPKVPEIDFKATAGINTTAMTTTTIIHNTGPSVPIRTNVNQKRPSVILPLSAFEAAPLPRLCRLRAYDSNLGFSITDTKEMCGYYKLSDIQPNSPAYTSGLRNDDIVIEVSGIRADSLNYDDFARLIKDKKDEDDLQLLVVDMETFIYFKNKKIEIIGQNIPKLIYIETLFREEMQFSLTDSSNKKYQVSRESLNALEQMTTNSKFIKSSIDYNQSGYIVRKIYI